MIKQRIRVICWLTCLLLLLSGCAWRTRQVAQLPPLLHRIQLHYPDAIDVSLLKTWQASLTAMGVEITQDRTAAIFNLQSSDITYTASNVVNSNLPISYVFTGTLTYAIEKSDGQVLFGPSTLSTSVSVSMPEQSLYDSSQTQLTRQRINQALLLLLYSQLTSPALHQVLHPKTKHHHKRRHRVRSK